GVLIGLAMYLPFSITFGYGLGCLSSIWLTKRHGVAFYQHKLVPIAAGLIVGEAIMGIFHAVYKMASGFGG
ncbi:MAG: OPT/YSL family transporter, partial [Myxococcota bacterium]|nr:OPT/YSL family transporter [Myxococcota bacterium]